MALTNNSRYNGSMKGYRLSAARAPLRLSDGLPPLQLIEPLLDVAPGDAGGHWYWRGEENVWREPVVRWRPAEERPAGLFPVIRALFEYKRCAIPRMASLRSVCGLAWCVNPNHWELETQAQRGERQRVVVRRNFGF